MMYKGNRTKLPRLKALMVAVHAAWGCVAWALPQDATVVNGQVAITQPAAGAMRINASNGAIIHWRQFSIGAGESTRFIQPSATSAVLNRVVGSEASQLLGQLQSNGQVFLINPHGIVVGAGARIDTGSFIASTLDIADADFLAGKLRFFERGSAGRIDNSGLITAGPGGRIFLIAPDIQNSGILHAPDGQILLAAGRKLEITSMDLDGIRFEIQAPTDSVLNLGQLLAENGAIGAFAGTLRHAGTAQANRLALDADGSIVLAGSHALTLDVGSITQADGARGGNIVLQSAQGTTRLAGTVSAQGSAGQGGDIRVLGERVSLQAGTTLDASGSQGGGQILVGGDYQGRNAAVQNAGRVAVAEGATLRADATAQGDGGRVIVWSDENTRFAGHLSAQGAGQGGDGGFAEVSGKQNLEFTGTANLGAPLGSSGTLLLDPLDIIISATSGLLPSVVDEFADFPLNVVTVSPTALAALQANVMLQANRDIYIKDALTLTATGAGVTMLAGGATYTDGAIYNNAGITTVGGAVTLRANGIYGSGGITTAGGAVDILTTGNLYYTSAIATANGSVSLASSNGSVYYANVDAGSGAIQASASANGTSASVGIYGGTYVTTGSAGFSVAGTNGRISNVDVQAATATLVAERDVSATVAVSDRVNASSTTSSVFLAAGGDAPLRLGTVSAGTSLSLQSAQGIAMAPQGMLSAAYIGLNVDGSTVAAGSADAPLLITAPSANVQPTLSVYGATAPIHINLAAGTVLGSLALEGSVTGLGGSTLSGGSLASAGFSSGTGMLNVALATSSGLAGGLSLSVRDGGIHASSLSLPDARATLTAQGGVTLDAFAGGALVVSARGDVSIGSAQTTGSSGISVSARQCNTFDFACAATNNITAGTLSSSGGGSIGLYTYDNGTISVTALTSASDVSLSAGRVFATASYPYYTSQATTNGISLGSVVAGRDVSVNNVGHGNVGIGSLQAAREVDIRAGSSYQPVAFGPVLTTNNQITVQNTGTGAAGDYTIQNAGTGSIVLGGAVDRTVSGSVYLQTSKGSISASGDIAARYYVGVYANMGAVSLANARSTDYGIDISADTSVLVGQLAAGSLSTYGSVNIQAGGDLRFASIQSSGSSGNYGSVSLASYGGAIGTTLDNPGMDVVATGNVTVQAYDSNLGNIGNAAFTNPLNIQAGSAATVTLLAGKDIGAVSKAVTVDTTGTIDVTSSSGQFHVAATDGATERTVSTIRLAASATGVGAGQSSTFTSANLDVTASSDGSALTIGDLVQTTGALTEFAFQSLGGGLNFGDVNLASTGIDRLVLGAQGALTQTTGNIVAGNLSLDAGAGNVSVAGSITANSPEIASPGRNNILKIRGADISTGALQAQSIDVVGLGNVVVSGAATTTGTQRSYANTGYDYTMPGYPLDELKLSAGGSLTVTGNVNSATSAILGAGAAITVGGGAGAVTGGSFGNGYYNDRVQMTAGAAPGGAISTGAVSAHDTTLQAHTITVGTVNVNQTATLAGTDIHTAAITAGYFANLSAVNLLDTGSITAPYVTLASNTFDTGALSASNVLTITAAGAYAPSNVAHSTSYFNLTAVGDITLLGTNGTTVTAPQVRLASSAGNIRAELLGTSNLTLDAGRGFGVTSNTWLSNLSVTAQWDQATDTGNGAIGASVTSSTASGTQNFGYSLGTGLQLGASSTLAAGRGWSLLYNDTSLNPVVASGNDFVVPTLSHAGSGSFDLRFASETVVSNLTASLGVTSGSSTAASLAVTSYGGIHLASVQTNGGSVSAYSHNGDIQVGLVSTTAEGYAGSVSLSTDAGSILLDGGGSHLIATGNSCSGCTLPTTVSYGTVTLYAPNGSIGGNGTLALAYANRLALTAHDTIDVAMAQGSLNGLTVTTYGSGSGTLSIANANFGGLSLTRSAGNILLGGLNPVALTDFSLTTNDGSIVVTSDIANVGNLRLYAASDLLIAASGGPRSVTTQTLDLHAGQDIRITAGAGAADDVALRAVGSSGYSYLDADRDVVVQASGGTALVDHAAVGYTQYVTAGRDLLVRGGNAGVAGATADIRTAGYQSFSVGRDFTVEGGASSAAAASVEAAYGQSFGNVGGNLTVMGGAGDDATARVQAQNGIQTLGSGGPGQTIDRLLVQGGSGARASASVLSSSSQQLHSDGDIIVMGGSGAGANAVVASAAGSQVIGSNYTYATAATQNILVQGGAGGYATIQANGSQTLEAGQDITVRGGSGNQRYATVETTGTQTIGNSTINTYFNSYIDPTANIVVEGGSGTDAYAAIRTTLASSGAQTFSAGGDVRVLGGAGAGAYAEIASSGTGSQQNIGSTDTSGNDPTANITVLGGGGSGAEARVRAQGSQMLLMGGDLAVTGGSGANANAYVQSASGAQTIGNTSTFFNDSTGSIKVTGGTAAGAAAWLRAATGQTLNAGNTIELRGGSAGNTFAEVSAAGGFQVLNNSAGGDGVARGVSLLGGSAAGSDARLWTGGSQQLVTSGDVVLTGGTGDQSGALMEAATGQYLAAGGALRITGGTGSSVGGNITGIDNLTSGSQALYVSGDIVLTAGGAGSDTAIINLGSGSQTLSSSTGSIRVQALAASASNDAVVMIESGAGGQALYAYAGTISVDNAGALSAHITSEGDQALYAGSLSVTLSSTASLNGTGPDALIESGGNQSVWLGGDGATPGSATLSVINRSGAAGSLAALRSGGDTEILMDYNAAGLVQIGATDALGRSVISANTKLTLVAGGLLLQGGLTAAADALLLSAQADPTDGIMVLSTLFGPVELKGGALGGAYIDPPELYITSNGSVLLQAGAGAGADANINAGLFQLAATTGDLSLVTSPASSATATITAGSFFYVGPGGVYLINGTITAPNGGTINVPLQCVNCDINIFGPVEVNAFVPPPVDYAALVAGDVTSLAELGGGLFEVLFDEDGNLVFSRRRLNQCF